MTVLDKINTFIQKHNLCNSGTPMLVACSGGIDSMVLLDVLLKLNYSFAVAHCNFKLRGTESDDEMKFVADFCTRNNIRFFAQEFDTLHYKKENKISTQIAARQLRYEWFEKIRKENHFHCIVTAHHADDQLETILLNFTKGTGVNGLVGMKPKNNFIIRPMLAITKAEIMDFALANKIEYREDSSNSSNDYQRNKVRHNIIPVLKDINPNISAQINDFSNRMLDVATLLELQIEQIKKKCYTEKEGIIRIKINYIKNHISKNTIIYYMLKDFGFSNDVMYNVLYNSQTSAQFFSTTHRMILDRKELIVTSVEQDKMSTLFFEKIPNKIQFNNAKIECKLVPIEKLSLKENKQYAYFDADKIEFPLLIRYLKNADYFYPFGMKKSAKNDKVGKKKITKYFRDLKLNLLEKEKTPIIFSNEKALWLVGHCIDDRFKITSNTKFVLKMKCTFS